MIGSAVVCCLFKIGIALFISGKVSGIYGIAVAALGMLSFVGTTVSLTHSDRSPIMPVVWRKAATFPIRFA